MKNKSFFIVFFLIALIAIIAGISLFTQTHMSSPTPVSNLNDLFPSSTSPATTTLPAPVIEVRKYEDKNNGFSLYYPSIYHINTTTVPSAGTLAPIVGVFSPEAEHAGTNLVESGVSVGINRLPSSLTSCTKMQADETTLGKMIISKTEFSIFTHQGAAAGNRYEAVRYRALAVNACYEITLLMHSGAMENYPALTVREFDRSLILDRLKAILYSFEFIR